MACQVEIDALRAYGVPDEHPEGGTCGECRNCVVRCFDAMADRVARDDLNACYGICVETPEHPYLVALDEEHSWDECWTGAA